jgi:hypothetical protein
MAVGVGGLPGAKDSGSEGSGGRRLAMRQRRTVALQTRKLRRQLEGLKETGGIMTHAIVTAVTEGFWAGGS